MANENADGGEEREKLAGNCDKLGGGRDLMKGKFFKSGNWLSWFKA